MPRKAKVDPEEMAEVTKPDTTEMVIHKPDDHYLPTTANAVNAVIERMGMIQELMRRAMIPNVDYGQIPGTNSKPTLLKPGAEKLCVMFRLCPKYETTKTWNAKHLIVESTCTICDLDGHELGQASAICTTEEGKYGYRNASRVCPACGKPAIIKGKEEYGGGWICFKKKDGCGAKFTDDSKEITDQVVGRIENPDIADTYNTVLRMAEKRAYMAAVRLVTGSSALFDEEIPSYEKAEDPVDALNTRINEVKDASQLTALWKEVTNSHTHLVEKLRPYFNIKVNQLDLVWSKEQSKFVPV